LNNWTPPPPPSEKGSWEPPSIPTTANYQNKFFIILIVVALLLSGYFSVIYFDKKDQTKGIEPQSPRLPISELDQKENKLESIAENKTPEIKKTIIPEQLPSLATQSNPSIQDEKRGSLSSIMLETPEIKAEDKVQESKKTEVKSPIKVPIYKKGISRLYKVSDVRSLCDSAIEKPNDSWIYGRFTSTNDREEKQLIGSTASGAQTGAVILGILGTNYKSAIYIFGWYHEDNRGMFKVQKNTVFEISQEQPAYIHSVGYSNGYPAITANCTETPKIIK